MRRWKEWLFYIALGVAIGAFVALLTPASQQRLQTSTDVFLVPNDPIVSAAPPRSQENPDDWSCSDFPSRCAVMFHAFALNAERARQLAASRRGGREFWFAVQSAAQIRELGAVLPASPIVLVTNYPTELVLALRRALESSNASAPLRWPFTDIVELQRPFKMKADALDALRAKAADVQRVLYLDGDTLVTVPSAWRWRAKALAASLATTTVLYEAFDALRFGDDLAMTPEMNAFRDGGPYLYADLLRMWRNVTDLSPNFNISANSTDNSTSSLVATVLVEDDNGPESRITNAVLFPRHRFSQRKPRFAYFALYETQFNTGVVAFRNTERAARFFEHWAQLHRASSRCRNDRIAWDQCSLPRALRTFDVKVVATSEALNVREALGYGCSALVYERGVEIVNHRGDKNKLEERLLGRFPGLRSVLAS